MTTAGSEPTGTRARVMDAVLDLLRTQRLRDLSLEDVAAAAAVSRQTVYRHFGSRDGLLRAVVIREEQRLAEVARAAVAGMERLDDAVARAVTVLLEGARDHPLLDRILSEDPEALLPYLTLGGGPVLGTSTTIVEELVRDFITADEEQIRLIADVLSRIVISYTVAPGDRTPQEVGAVAARIVRGGLLGPVTGEKRAVHG